LYTGLQIEFLVTGIPVRTTLDNSTTTQYSNLIIELASLAKSTIRDIDPIDDLKFLRIRSKKHEIMVAPGTVSGVWIRNFGNE
jgi:hypothetical protein